MNFTLTVLGTASAKPVPNRFQSAQVLSVRGRFFLIDCGEGAQTRMVQNNISEMKIDSIFISHIHGDHISGLFPLLSTMGLCKRTQPLNIYAPAAFAPLLKVFLSYNGDGVDFEVRHIPMNMKSPEIIYQTKSLEVSAFPLNHRIPTYGYLFREKEPQRNIRKDAIPEYGFTIKEMAALKAGEDIIRPAGPDEIPSIENDFTKYSGTDKPLIIKNSDVTYKPYNPRSYAYCSDTAPFPKLASWVKGVDLLYHETTYLDEMREQANQRHHSTTIQAATCARDAGVKKLIIGHYSSRCLDSKKYQDECRTVFPETYAANDGDVFDIPLEKLG